LTDYLDQLKTLIACDRERMRILRLVREVNLPDCWVAAGFVRSLVWDRKHARTHSPLPPDIDVIWFDKSRASPEIDARIETRLQQLDPTLNWSVKNQARMHVRNSDQLYTSAVDAMRSWPETATAVAARLSIDDILEVVAPLGTDDLFNLIVRPTPRFEKEKRLIYLRRLSEKNWQATWPRLNIVLV